MAANFDPPARRGELLAIEQLSVRHHPRSAAAAMLISGWLASRLGWQTEPLREGPDGLAGRVLGDDREVAVQLRAAPELSVPGLESVTLEVKGGRSLTLQRGPGGLHASSREQDGSRREWTVPGASRGETGVLGEGIRQALLRDPTYIPALQAARVLAAT